MGDARQGRAVTHPRLVGKDSVRPESPVAGCPLVVCVLQQLVPPRPELLAGRMEERRRRVGSGREGRGEEA